MEKQTFNQLKKTALFTTPVIALLLVTPVFLLAQVKGVNFFQLWLGVSFAVLINWTFNILILKYLKWDWLKSWLRILFSSATIFVVVQFAFSFSGFIFPVEGKVVAIIRLVNILAINSIIFILIDLILTKENKHQMELENTQLKFANLEAEFKLLKDQINPHFLFNALSTAKSLIKKEPGLAEEYIVRLSDFLRASIQNNQKTITLREEIEICKDFIDLNKIRFGQAFEVKFNLISDSENLMVPYFSVLTLLENALKHNAATLTEPILISVETDKKTLTVINNIQAKINLNHSPKTGLKNLNERYKLLTGREIKVEKNEKQFKVQFELIEA